MRHQFGTSGLPTCLQLVGTIRVLHNSYRARDAGDFLSIGTFQDALSFPLLSSFSFLQL